MSITNDQIDQFNAFAKAAISSGRGPDLTLDEL